MPISWITRKVPSMLESLLTRRPADRFPADSHGDVLWVLHRQGVDLTRPRPIEFHARFSGARQAGAFVQSVAAQLSEFGTRTGPTPDGAFGCIVTCTAILVPAHDVVSSYYDLLDDMAGEFGGTLDGWGTVVEA